MFEEGLASENTCDYGSQVMKEKTHFICKLLDNVGVAG